METSSVIRTLEALSDRDHRTKKGRPFDRGTLTRMLASPIYTGRIKAGDEVVEGEHEAIVDAETWEKTQEILGANKRPQRKKRASDALLAGLLRCGRCGTVMSPTYTRKKDRLYSYYQCQTSAKRGARACPGGRVPAAPIEGTVADRITCIGKGPDVVSATATATVRRLERERTRSDLRLDQLRARHEGLLRKRAAALDLAHSDPEQRAAHELLGQVTAELDQIETEIREAEEHATALASVEVHEGEVQSTLANFGDVWAELFPRERGRIIRQLVEQVVYDPESDEVEIRFRPEGFRLITGREER